MENYEEILNKAAKHEDSGRHSEAGRLYEQASEILRESGHRGPAQGITHCAQVCYQKANQNDDALRMRLTIATKGRVVFEDLPDIPRSDNIEIAERLEARLSEDFN